MCVYVCSFHLATLNYCKGYIVVFSMNYQRIAIALQIRFCCRVFFSFSFRKVSLIYPRNRLLHSLPAATFSLFLREKGNHKDEGKMMVLGNLLSVCVSMS